MTAPDLEGPLRAGCVELGLALDDAAIDRLLRYLALVAKWTRVYNLTAIRDPREMLTQHLLDCLAAVPPLRREQPGPGRVVDVGSGAGLPGVVFAICQPELRVDCVDTVAKKTAFVQQAATELGLPNLRGVHARIENVREPADILSSRAFASLPDFVRWSAAALGPQGKWMALKGKVPHEEIAQLPADTAVFHVEPLRVPGLDAERCIVWMQRRGSAAAGAPGA